MFDNYVCSIEMNKLYLTVQFLNTLFQVYKNIAA